ncbi:hypothetical protein [Dyadobacter sandarakinus]|uniref:DUF3300 domain-containing protein n=1 Tax=Dyadobacter sandarakinus TaxID=2747268 RepID=A0ABX7I2C1_9BACT|nr:hypothetical protein [Dyadobacter sandarakinus]QRR00015.1 hypothetical protein HWI92_03315 [Dyadobacter sandarakinus]
MKRLHLFAGLLLSAVSFAAYSQDNRADYTGTEQNTITENSLVKTIAPFDEAVRGHILTAIQYPDVLKNLSSIREKSYNGFQQVIQHYPQRKQAWFYEVSRYPELMHKLAILPEKVSREAVERMLPNQDPGLKTAAWKLYKNQHSALVAVDNLNAEAVNAFEQMIAPLNPEAQLAFKALQEKPDVLLLLHDHADLSARLGEQFRSNPEGVRQELAAAHEQLNAENRQELAAYQNDLAANPDAIKELSEASEEYATSGGYSYPAPAGEKVVNYGSPYSYWFGYPSWFGSPMWYPGLYGYGSGFYLGAGGYPVVYALPSLGFSNWFFGGAYRYYPHLYHQYDRYYRNTGIRNREVSASRNAFLNTARRHFNAPASARSFGYAPDRSYNAARRIVPGQSSRMPMQGNSYYHAPTQRSFNNRSFGGGSSFNRGGISAGSMGRSGFSGGSVRGGSRR